MLDQKNLPPTQEGTRKTFGNQPGKPTSPKTARPSPNKQPENKNEKKILC
jgi:hypothetical protein